LFLSFGLFIIEQVLDVFFSVLKKEDLCLNKASHVALLWMVSKSSLLALKWRRGYFVSIVLKAHKFSVDFSSYFTLHFSLPSFALNW